MQDPPENLHCSRHWVHKDAPPDSLTPPPPFPPLKHINGTWLPQDSEVVLREMLSGKDLGGGSGMKMTLVLKSSYELCFGPSPP